MALGEAVNIATASLWAHKMRSVLTLLGVVIGVTSVIAVVSLINGLNDYVANAISSNLSADVFMINRAPSNITSVDQWAESQKRKKFHLDDYEALRDNCHSCVAVAANLNKGGSVKYGTNTLDQSAILGFTHEMPEVYSRELAEGRYYTRLDVARHAAVCDVGFDIPDKLIPGVDPIGKIIHVDSGECEIIGVAKKRGSTMGQSQDDWVIMPITTYEDIYGANDSVRLWVKAAGRNAMEPTMDEVRMLLRARRHVEYKDPDDFAMETNAVVPAALGQHQQHVLRRHNRHRFHLADRGRHRHHEYHARIRHRADARNRPAKIAGRPASRYPDAVPDRIGHHRGGRRRGRGDFRHHTGENRELDDVAAEFRANLVGADGIDRGHQRWTVFRRLSGVEGGAARSCGCVEAGVRGSIP